MMPADLDAAAAVVLSRKGQIDLGLQIALGSSTQVALLVAPMLVFASVLMGRSMNLVFTPFEVLALAMATGVAAIITLWSMVVYLRAAWPELMRSGHS